MPWKVPMTPDAAMVALRGAVSNHRSRKSAALMVMSWMKVSWWRRVRWWNARASPARGSHSLISIRPGSGGTTDSTGLTNLAMSTISWPYSSYASASGLDHRLSSRMVRPWSSTRHR